MSTQDSIDLKKQRGERFGNTYVVTEEDTKNLRAARFVAEGSEAAPAAAASGLPNLERSLDDIAKDDRKKYIAEQKAKKAAQPKKQPQQQQKPKQQQPKQQQKGQQKPQQQQQNGRQQPQQQNGREQNQQNGRQQAPQHRASQQQGQRSRAASSGFATQRPQAQRAQPRGGPTKQQQPKFDDSANVSRMKSRNAQQGQKKESKKHSTDFLAMIDPAEAAARQARADRFKSE